MILAHFLGKKKRQMDARRRRYPRPSRDASALGRVPCGPSGLPGRTRARSSAGRSTWRAGLAEMNVPHVDHPCEEFATELCRRTNPAGARTERTSAARPDEMHLHAADRRALGRARCFRNALRCAAWRRSENPRRRQRPYRRYDDDRIGQRRSVDANARAQRSRGCNAACIDRGRSSVSRPVRYGEVVKRDLYTVEGRQTGDLRQK
jgi:hypothetical protein